MVDAPLLTGGLRLPRMTLHLAYLTVLVQVVCVVVMYGSYGTYDHELTTQHFMVIGGSGLVFVLACLFLAALPYFRGIANAALQALEEQLA